MPPVLLQPSVISPASLAAGGPQTVQSGGKSGEAFVAEIHDRYYQQVLAGNMFVGAAAAGTALTIPAWNATAQVFGLWNPAGSGKNAVLAAMDISFAVAPVVVSGYTLSYATGLGAQAATGGPVTAFTKGVLGTTYQNALIGSGNQSVMNFIPATLTLTTAAALLAPLGWSATVVTTAVWNLVVAQYRFEGRVIVPPGVAVFLTSIAAQTATSAIPSLWWYEMPQ